MYLPKTALGDDMGKYRRTVCWVSQVAIVASGPYVRFTTLIAPVLADTGRPRSSVNCRHLHAHPRTVDGLMKSTGRV